MSRVKIII